jgi:predicted amino acid-binding ACT domain protein
MDTVERGGTMATDLTISVEDRPGAMASVGEALGKAGINIEGICGLGFEGRGMIHLCVQDGAAARRALDAAGIKVEGEADAILGDPVAGADQPGTMGAMARQVADAGINVRAAYLATNSRVVMVTDDNAKLMELIAKMM